MCVDTKDYTIRPAIVSFPNDIQENSRRNSEFIFHQVVTPNEDTTADISIRKKTRLRWLQGQKKHHPVELIRRRYTPATSNICRANTNGNSLITSIHSLNVNMAYARNDMASYVNSGDCHQPHTPDTTSICRVNTNINSSSTNIQNLSMNTADAKDDTWIWVTVTDNVNTVDVCFEEGHHPCFLQLYVYDTRDDLRNKMHHFGRLDESALNLEIVKGLIHVLDEHNGLIRLINSWLEDNMLPDTFTGGPVLYTIEFQKRGLPNCHTLLWIESRNTLNNATQIDEYISAEIPDPVQDPRGYKLVTELMMHDPCGFANLDASEPEEEDQHSSCITIPPEYSIGNDETGQRKIYLSNDEAIPMGSLTSKTELLYPTGYLSTITFPEFLPHELELKVGPPIMLLRNVNLSGSFCNGTRMIVRCKEFEFPEHHFEFVAYNQLASRIPYPDYIGCIRSIGDIKPFGDANTGQKYLRKEEIENLDGNILEFTMWDDIVKQFNKQEIQKLTPPIIIAAAPVELQNTELTATPVTYYYINPRTPEAGRAYTVFKEKYSLIPPLQILKYRE
nr:DNA helicase [Tanacetum cinerariifolium]